MASYSFADRALHRIALSARSLREMAFDMETANIDGRAVMDRPHVFVAGLARAGTSILLRALHATGSYATLSYRDMPFVLAPRLWTQMTGRFRTAAVAEERAHGDGLEVSFDSPEAFEEVFWLTFADRLYVNGARLAAHDADDELIDQFRDYAAAVIAARGGRLYLSKNNNNILRLGAIARAFPQAHILVPFRDPVAQAGSLLAQHKRFSEQQRKDRFAANYMGWLGHFEFGLGRRAFDFGGFVEAAADLDPMTLDFWLAQWTHVYQSLLARRPANARFWNYDAMCAAPSEKLSALGALVGAEIDAGAIAAPAKAVSGARADSALIAAARVTHARLRSAAI